MNLDSIVRSAEKYTVILQPDKDLPEWWAGAPSVVVDNQGRFLMAARMREGNSPRGQRGYEVRILESSNGIDFRPIHSLFREALKVPGLERPSLLFDPATGLYSLFLCAGFPDGWRILRLDDVSHPSQFDPRTCRTVLTGDQTDDGFVHVVGYKDPFILRENRQLHMFVTGGDVVERIYHFSSSDGEIWHKVNDDPVLENTGWHRFYTRPACILPMPVGYLFVYEGSDISWTDPVYNIATGLAFSPDLISFIDLTPDQPLLRSTTPGRYQTWRYSHWVQVDANVFVYFEASRPDDSNELRCFFLGEKPLDHPKS